LPTPRFSQKQPQQQALFDSTAPSKKNFSPFDTSPFLFEVAKTVQPERTPMKGILILPIILLAAAALAETSGNEESLQMAAAMKAKETPPAVDLDRPNEITVGPISYSGIAVQTYKIDNLAQLINPAAPERYGFAEENILRDPITDKVSGLKIFSIQF
jgi:hypothetical protein